MKKRKILTFTAIAFIMLVIGCEQEHVANSLQLKEDNLNLGTYIEQTDERFVELNKCTKKVISFKLEDSQI